MFDEPYVTRGGPDPPVVIFILRYKRTAPSAVWIAISPPLPPTAPTEELLITLIGVTELCVVCVRRESRPAANTNLRPSTYAPMLPPIFSPDGGLFLDAPIFQPANTGLFLFELLNFGGKNNLLCTSTFKTNNVQRCDDQPAADPACCFDCPVDPAPAEQ